VESYSDADIARWDLEDQLAPQEKTAILEQLGIER
jgi:hypothetical protein